MPLRTSSHRKAGSARWLGRSSKHRDMLSVNMISLPLADFRHISHIGKDANADSFGDLSFLKMGRSLLLQSSQSEQNLFLACSPPPKPPRLNLDEADTSEELNWPLDQERSGSQKRKKCSSMPLLDSEEGGEEEMEAFRHNVGTNQTRILNLDGEDKATVKYEKPGQQKEEDNGLSFNLDLGPSILDDVLQVMEKLHH